MVDLLQDAIYCLFDCSVYFLRRLKINQDFHEFILEIGTVVNKYYEGNF
jgi:hypothetical protein